MRVTGSSGETRVAKSTGEKTRTIGGGYRSSLSHQGGARTFVSDDSLETTGTSSTQDLECCSWSSSGESGFHKHAPLLAKPLRPSLTRQEPDGTAEEQPVLDEIAEFGQIMEQQRQQLPGTWYYSSNHILVNRGEINAQHSHTNTTDRTRCARKRTRRGNGQAWKH
ncbi:hypothetical protein MHU86_17718 [Fragilaria crotonensis]|nr:hypothetical protein MHU86_17718 [Fragilaria crotonensis]